MAPLKKKRGPKPHQPSDETNRMVDALVISGVTQERIAGIIGISETSLKRHYSEALKNARQKALGRNTVNLMNMAENGDHSAAIYLQKCLGGNEWKEKIQSEQSGETVIRVVYDK